jgi:two-component system, cell cycle response regulator CpdR
VSRLAAGQIAAVRRSTFAMAQAFTVLLVDDDDLVRAPLAALLKLHGVRVLTATSAIEAIRILGQERADVLFTDIVMPDQDGIELARHAKALQPHLRIMFATGYFSRAASAEQLGKLLFKPLRADEVQAALDDVLADKSPPRRKRR